MLYWAAYVGSCALRGAMLLIPFIAAWMFQA
jgi:hypothetical protein